MMQLARELKTLAREFSLAVVVSVAVPSPSCAGMCRGEEPRRAFWIPWERGPCSQLSRSERPLLPTIALLLCSPWLSCSSKCVARTGLISSLLLLLSPANKAFT